MTEELILSNAKLFLQGLRSLRLRLTRQAFLQVLKKNFFFIFCKSAYSKFRKARSHYLYLLLSIIAPFRAKKIHFRINPDKQLLTPSEISCPFLEEENKPDSRHYRQCQTALQKLFLGEALLISKYENIILFYSFSSYSSRGLQKVSFTKSKDNIREKKCMDLNRDLFSCTSTEDNF